VLIVDDIDAEYGCLTTAGGEILTPIQTEDWASGTSRSPIPTG
jgi:hypothetical protein